jgi:hypothetical protein
MLPGTGSPAGGARPVRRGRRPRRRGGAERPINPRTVRGTWLLVALPLLLAALLVGRPQPLPAPALPPGFDGTTAAALAQELARDYPDRSPGSADALGAAAWFRDQLRLYGFEPQLVRFRTRLPGRGHVELRNVVAVAPGPSRGAIVFLAHRDNTGASPGENDNASGTAALIELARAYAPVAGPSGVRARPEHTLVFVSTDGGAYGALGAARFANRSPLARDAVAVVVLDALAGPGRARLVLDGDAPRVADGALVRTVATRLLEETGREPGRPGVLRQLLDLGFPHTLREQGPLLARDVPALTVTTLPEQRPGRYEDAPLDVQRLTEVGRGVQGILGSLDQGLELTQGTSPYVYLGSRTVLGWTLALVLISALLPFLIGTVDLFARLRRRRVPLRPAFLALRDRVGFWLFAALVLLAGAQVGLFPLAEPGRPLAPDAPGVEPDAVRLALVGAVLGLGWLVGRERLIPRRRAAPDEALAGHCAALLALALLALLVVVTNPYALVYLLPSLYAWLWLPQVHGAPALARILLFLTGLSGAVLLLVAVARPYGMGAETPWYVLSLLASGYVPWPFALFCVAWLAAAAQLAALAAGRYAPYPDAGDRTSRLHRRSRRRPRLRAVTGGRNDAVEA